MPIINSTAWWLYGARNVILFITQLSEEGMLSDLNNKQCKPSIRVQYAKKNKDKRGAYFIRINYVHKRPWSVLMSAV